MESELAPIVTRRVAVVSPMPLAAPDKANVLPERDMAVVQS